MTFLLLCSSQAAAYMASEDESLQMVYGNEHTLSLATGYEQLLYKAPAVASVITRQQVDASSANTLNELLEMVPGLHVSENYSYGDAIYGMRGFQREPNAGLLVLLNGMALNNLQNGSRPAAFQLPVTVIDHVEIIRGPGSAVYGADAFVGVINVVTRGAGNMNSGQAGAGMGSFGQQSAWYQSVADVADWKISYSLDWLAAGHDTAQIAGADMQSYFDAIAGTTASLAPAAMPGGYKTVNFMADQRHGQLLLRQWLWSNLEQGNAHGIPGIDVLDPVGHTESRALGLSAEYQQPVSDEAMWSARLDYLRYEDRHIAQILPPGSDAPIGDDGNLFSPDIRSVIFPAGMRDDVQTQEDHVDLDWSGYYRGYDNHILRLSAGFQYRCFSAGEQRNFGPGVLDAGQVTAPETLVDTSGDDLIFLPANSRRNYYLSLQDEWDFIRDWSFTAGIRHDHYSDFGGTLNPRLALVWQTRHDLTTKLLYGQAFRAPVFNELYVQNRPGSAGNPDLRPEIIRTLELSFNYRPRPVFKTTLSLFAHRAEDLIVPVASSAIANTLVMENQAEQHGSGIEWEATWYARDNVQLSGNYSWQYSPVPGTAYESPYAPFREASLQLSWRPVRYWMLHGNLHWLDSAARQVGDPRQAMDAQARLDITLRYRNHYTPWEYALITRNLLDADLAEASVGNASIASGAALPDDVPMAGRAVYAQVKYYFAGQ